MDLCDYLEMLIDNGDTIADCLDFVTDSDAVKRAGFTESDIDLAIESLAQINFKNRSKGV
jgi:hypothetical protein